jgi:hypothetical protein
MVLKGFSFHDVAPVTGGIANGQKYGLIFLLRLLKRLISPGIPIHGIIGMLQQIGAFLMDEPIGLSLCVVVLFCMCHGYGPPNMKY